MQFAHRAFVAVQVLGMLVVLATSVGCKPKVETTSQLLAGRTMGTTYSVTVVPSADWSLQELNERISSELELVNRQMSTYIGDSELSKFNQSRDTQTWFPVSADTAQVVDAALHIGQTTAGAFDVTVGPLVNLWGFGPDARPDQTPSQEQIEEARRHAGLDKLEVSLDPPALRKSDPLVQVDLSAIAKGHGVDRVAEVLRELGVEHFFVEVGGEVRVGGKRLDGKPWRVGIERPAEEQRSLLAVLELSDRAMATSGNYRNFYFVDGQRFSHTIDPRTGRPVAGDLLSATVIADNCQTADAIATSMMCLGWLEGLRLANQEGWCVLLVVAAGQDMEVKLSDSFERDFPDFETIPSDAEAAGDRTDKSE